jgi:putative transposase
MARQPRLTVAGYPHHIIQRGNDRQLIVRSDRDRVFLLELIHDYAKEYAVAIHAYVLMDNHFHLLATPATTEGLPLMMQAVGRRYVRYYNGWYQRTGSLWEGRYKSTLIETERYLLACMAYIDLNPVRAGMVTLSQDYPWSSHAHYMGLRADRLITPHALYWELGNTPFAREAAYSELVRAGVNVTQQTALTESALRGWALGEPDFLGELQKKTSRRATKGRAGRPTLALSPVRNLNKE